MRYWKRVNTQDETTTVESFSHNLDIEGAIEITEQKYDEFIASLPIPEPELEKDDIRASEILATSVEAIPRTEVWELLRIFGRKLGYQFSEESP